MDNFTYFHFRTVDFDVVQAHLSGKYGDQLVLKGYQEWLDSFGRNAGSFYSSQLDRHWLWLLHRFYDESGLDKSRPLDSYDLEIEQDFELYLAENGYGDHLDALAVARDEHSDALDMYWPNRPLWYTSEESIEHLKAVLMGGIAAPGALCPEIWSLWFDETTRNGEDEQRALRQMSYPDYLKSAHWKLTRATMLVVHRLRCQCVQCYARDNWHFNEQELHVHHMHYKTKGREKLDDLRLLCSQCHRKHHEGDTSIVPAINWDLVRI